MPYEITALLDQMPKGRMPKPTIDKYDEFKQLLEQIALGSVAQIPMPKDEYRAFSAAIRAAGQHAGKKVECIWKSGSAYVSWVNLTEENRRKFRGGRRKRQAPEAAAPLTGDAHEEQPVSVPDVIIDEETDPSLIGDMDAEVPPDVALFQAEARRRQRRNK